MSDMIYVDFSILSTFRACEEKARLAYHEHLVPVTEARALTFGSAFHEGLASFYRAKVKGSDNPVQQAKLGFLNELQSREANLPIAQDNDEDEKRSVERGLALIECYFEVYKNEPYDIVIAEGTGEPYVEMGFAVYLMEWKGKPVMYVGKFDRIMHSRADGRLYNIETKTTTQGLSQFMNQVRPNHQITGYHWAAKELLQTEFAGTVLDATFVSSRKPNVKKKGWEYYGIDTEKDFGRTETRRNATDIEEFILDTIETTSRMLALRDSNRKRWNRSAPTACHQYGGCQFTKICSFNQDEKIISNFFKKERWAPWEDLLKASGGLLKET